MTLDLWLKLISTIATVAIGIAASILAFHQYRISKSKLKFDLYEKRLALFRIVRDFASAITPGKEFDSGEFYRSTIERYFLFEKDVCDYIDVMYEKAMQVELLIVERTAPQADRVEAARIILIDEKKWFHDQGDNMIKVFSKYLSIKTLQ